MWSEEFIPNQDSVYIRVAKSNIKRRDKKPATGAFSNTPKTGDNLSSDWSKYCTPESSLELIGFQKSITTGEFKNPDNFFIWKFKVEHLRNNINPSQNVQHDPIYRNPEIEGEPNNRAHSIIIGTKPVDDRLNRAEFRMLMVENGEWVIGPSS